MILERSLSRAAAFAVALLTVLASFALANATGAGATANATCVRNGDTLSWTDVGASKYQLRIAKAANSSSWVRTVQSATSTQLTAADKSKSNLNSFLIRYKVNGQNVTVGCNTAGAIDQGDDGFCTQTGGTLDWRAAATSEDGFHIRRVTNAGTSWVTKVSNDTTFDGSANEEYVVRYRMFEGTTLTTVNTPCGQDNPGGTVTCTMSEWSFGSDIGEEIQILGTTPGVSYTLLIDGVASGQNDTPFTSTGDGIGGVPNPPVTTYFGFSFQPTPLRTFEVVPTAGGATIPCGTSGQDPVPVASCIATEGDNNGEVNLFVGDTFALPFDVIVDGVAVPGNQVWPVSAGFPADWAVPAASYTAPGTMASSISILNADGTSVVCAGAGAALCAQDANSVDWFPGGINPPVKDNVVHIRRVRADGSTKWVATTSLFSFRYVGTDPDTDYILRYRLLDGTVVNNDCLYSEQWRLWPE